MLKVFNLAVLISLFLCFPVLASETVPTKDVTSFNEQTRPKIEVMKFLRRVFKTSEQDISEGSEMSASKKTKNENSVPPVSKKQSVEAPKIVPQMKPGDPLLRAWKAGLSAWSREDYYEAARYFKEVSISLSASDWFQSTGSFWAARAHRRAGDYKNVSLWLKRAAQHPQTFYGMLARFSLGKTYDYDWSNANTYPIMFVGGNKNLQALTHAIILQESQFNTEAKSKRGARGLMQIMPDTAASLVQGKNYDLHNPAHNVKIGQAYLEDLLRYKAVGNDLISLIAAYNAGPGNLTRWKAAGIDSEDPLYFIESLPLSETRAYVERVLVNYWIYQLRGGQIPYSLHDIAQGQWPQYQSHSIKTASKI